MWQTALYNLLLMLLLVLALPKLIYQRVRYGKYRGSLAARLGLQTPKVDKQGRFLVWLHCVSVGESKAVVALAKKLRQNPNCLLVVSSITETGHTEAKKSMPFADAHFFLPLDFSWLIQPLVRSLSPDLVLIAENDLWPNFLRCAKKSGASIAIINGKISGRTYKRLSFLPGYTRWLFSNLDLICVQGSSYAKLFEKLHVPPPLVVTGNMKLDQPPKLLSYEELSFWRQKLMIKEGDFVLVAGSTHHPEEELLLDALQAVWQKNPHVKLILVPRHPERFDRVASLIEQRGIGFSRYSQPSANSSSRVLLVDAMGVLMNCYQVADLAFVGGSFTEKVGGHNIIEPSWFGVPVFFGPHMHSQPDLLSLVEHYRAGLQIAPEEIPQTIQDFVQNSQKRQAFGESGLKLVASQQGATERTWQALKPYLS